jgi:PadR family transcriptional regulator
MSSSEEDQFFRTVDSGAGRSYFGLGTGWGSAPTAKQEATDPTMARNAGEPRDLFPGALEMMVLQILKRQPMYGYALVQHIVRRSSDLLKVEEGSLYPALQRLLKEGLVTAEWGVSPKNRRVRIYRLTAKGAKHLEHEVSRFEQMLKGITRVLAPVKS